MEENCGVLMQGGKRSERSEHSEVRNVLLCVLAVKGICCVFWECLIGGSGC